VERIRSSLLGLTEGPILCPRQLCLALDFGRKNPVVTAYRLLRKAGFDDPEELRLAHAHHLDPMACSISPDLRPLEVDTADPIEVLRQALLLGLCTGVRFDPARPVVWTQASLTRRLELFDMTEFYS
jgi:hypothetical protein